MPAPTTNTSRQKAGVSVRPVTIFDKILLRVQRGVAEVTWPFLAAGVAIHVVTSWVALAVMGEGEIASGSVFPYYYLTTATTVGYGDFSPATTAGRYIGGFWIMPGAVLLFTAVVGKLIQAISDRWTRAMKGREDFSDLENHVVVFGWRGEQTRRLLELLLAEDEAAGRGLVLVSIVLDENPMPNEISFVNVAALSGEDAVTRSAAGSASVALIMGENDDETLAAALSIGSLPNAPRIVAYFQTAGPAALLRSYIPTAEAQESISTELMARSAYDPGAARLQRIMLSSLEGPTQYSFTIPEGGAQTDCAAALATLKQKCDATLIAVKRALDADVTMNPSASLGIGPGDRVFYIADHRLKESEVAGVLV